MNTHLPDVLNLARQGYPAWMIVERLGLPRSERTVQRWINQHLGSLPTKRAVARRDPLRSRVVAAMVAGGLNEHYCYVCQRLSLGPCLIRELARDLDVGSLAFVCRKCARPGDL